MAKPEATLRQRTNGDHAWAVAGMALFWPILRNPFLLGLLSSDHLEPSLSVRYSIYFGTCALAAVVLYAMTRPRSDDHKQGEPHGRKAQRADRLFLAGAITAGVGYALCMLSSGGGMQTASFVFGCMLCAIAVSMTTFSWFSVLSRFELSSALRVCALSFALSFLSVVLDLVPDGLRQVVQVAFPLSSCIVGLILARRLPEAPSSITDHSDSAAIQRQWRTIAMLCLICLFASIFISAINSSSLTSYTAKPGSYITYGVSALSALCLVATFRAAQRPQMMLAGGLLVGATTVLLASFLMLSIGSGMGLPTTCHTVMEFLLFACLLCVGRATNAPAGAALFAVGAMAISWCERVALPYLFILGSARLTDFGASMALVACAIVSFLALASAGAALLHIARSDRFTVTQTMSAETVANVAASTPEAETTLPPHVLASTPEAESRPPLEAHVRLAANVQRVAVAHGLTPREVDVLELVAQGHSVRKISETLCISPSTVQGHMRNVYAKLGLHSRQDVIDYCQEASEQE